MIINHLNKEIMDCAIRTDTLIIKTINDKQIGIAHCGHREAEIVNPLYFDDVYKMSSDEFWTYLQESYKKIPENHNYTPDYSCNTKNKRCVYNDKSIKKVVVSTSRRCNIHCNMCMVSSNTYLPIEEDKKLYFDILYKLKNHNIYEIGLTHNGEPFLSKNQTFEYLNSLQVGIDCSSLCITTNGILLNEQDILKLKSLKDKGFNIYLMVSCCAITPETYQKVHNNNNFYTVVNNIEQLHKYGLLSSISFVIQNDNLHELEFLKDYWYNKGVTVPLYARILVGFDGKNVAQSQEYRNFLEMSKTMKNIYI